MVLNVLISAICVMKTFSNTYFKCPLRNANLQGDTYGSTCDIYMNTKWIHFDQCYYNEYKMNSQRWSHKGPPNFLLILSVLWILAYVKNQGESLYTHIQTKMHIFIYICIYQKSMSTVITLLGRNSLKHSIRTQRKCVCKILTFAFIKLHIRY